MWRLIADSKAVTRHAEDRSPLRRHRGLIRRVGMHGGIAKSFRISGQLQSERVDILGTGVFNQHRRIIWRQPYPRTHQQIPRLANVRQA